MPKNKDDKCQKLEKKVEELTHDLKRAHADFINYKRRVEEDKQRAIRFGRESAVMALLPVIDNIERAFSHLPKDLIKNSWALGVKQIAKQLEDALKGIGVEKFASKGKEFDPHRHEAIADLGGQGKREVVAEELQPGYMMDGEVIRHALVKIRRK